FLSALNASIILTANTGKRQTSQFLEMLSRLSDCCGGRDECWRRSMNAADLTKATKDIGDVCSKDTSVFVAIVDDDVTQAINEPSPWPIVVLHNPDEHHVGVSKGDLHLISDVVTQILVLRAVIVADHMRAHSDKAN